MDIMNELSPERFAEVDDLLAFISIYDDEQRSQAYFRMLAKSRALIEGQICVEAGCGLGLFSEYMAKLGARKVYAVESNSLLYELASERLEKYPNVEVVRADISNFSPEEEIDVLVHELFGPLLYDEDVRALDHLKFEPKHVLPERAVLMGGTVPSSELTDDVVSASVLKKLAGCLVSGLFDENGLDLSFPVIEWRYGKSTYQTVCDLSNQEGDLLYLGLQIFHRKEKICQAGACSNWSFVWTPRLGDSFRLNFLPAERGTDVHFEWS